ncbi:MULTISPECIES: nucleotide sugar dehydrogenase [unclassified Leeuwenhoekiella]|uniref:nucleotide sugar dehydrogenase n=1 Tax=unclassified Leeuwenhoekiella TaxID=2615029 RepID=UPI000C446309|nr:MULTISPECIES: nucleotide sugar dehydrogenase [unclassified Leeuwenhoekiella]MAW94822.1 UDP-N-acetyl-D-galactosamine dehydrogenase [Leeuwenhoekiella sp.]MBA79542.1 UDP-N-acetyl-D-galactosamine dehydrogenase [Leeuwenhoekiella sp.]|tara:strand:- start:11858 stop:13129 length:1272 start_codon:yes stop_codon:yes gene_type:complete
MKIGVIGLGYVGLPLARLFATQYDVVGFDLIKERVKNLQNGDDHTGEVEPEQLKAVLKEVNSSKNGLFCTSNPDELKSVTIFIVTVPTPIDQNNNPDLSPLISASKTVATYLKNEDVVIYESTVYPGVTEEVCIPILEENSGLQFNVDFFAGYSPERINPGDKTHTVDKIRKVTSGSNAATADLVDNLYASVISAGTYKAASIKVAEAAKVIENSQRDINIAFVNELAKIFNLLEIDTQQVLEAAGTKWNFLPFKPGLVGGHCIGVDPYYLAQKAKQVGYHPEIILAGRRLNDSMGTYIASQIVKLMAQRDIKLKDSAILVLGITFKENCPDVRNTRVVDIIRNLEEYGAQVSVYDPQADAALVHEEYGYTLIPNLTGKRFSAIVLAVSHSEFAEFNLEELKAENAVVYDVKGFYKNGVDGRL